MNYLNFINGRQVDSDTHIIIDDPATGAPMGRVAEAHTTHVEDAVAAARQCVDQGLLTRIKPAQRGRWLHDIADALRARQDEGARLLTLENGKSLSDSVDEINEAADYFDYYAGMADKLEGKSIPLGPDYLDFTLYEPHGVSAQIVPWNFPVSLTARSAAPALASGNAVIAKTPELCPLACTLIADACADADVPAGAFNLLCGYGHKAGAHLVGHAGVDQIVFTGSVKTGQAIMRSAAQRAVPCVMELGGKSAAVVFDDADIEGLLDSIRWGIFFNSGQVCSAMSRLLVSRSRYEEVIARVAAMVDTFTLGPGIDNHVVTPLASQTQQQQVLAHCAKAVQDGARVVCGGNAPEREGFFVHPTVFADVTPDMAIFSNEVFGPVIAVTPFDDEQEAYHLANATDYGLVAGVFTQDLSRSLRAAQSLQAGQVFVNEWYAGGIATPFGGVKMSGYGREKGLEALYTYVRTKNVAIRLNR
ncbi:MAG: aldehyde dehydrogenase family protein [Pseudomonadota bacterium]